MTQPIVAVLIALLALISHGVAASESLEPWIKNAQDKPAVLATLVDGDLQPIVDVQLHWSIGISTANSSHSSGGYVRSDEKGRVRIPLIGAHAEAGARHFEISPCRDGESVNSLQYAYASRRIPPGFTSGELDLGELIVVPFGAPQRFLRTDDESLRSAFETPRESSFRAGAHEEILFEMVRRGGPSWQMYVSGRLAVLRAEMDKTRGHDVRELELLTALRRLQHKPDPLALVIQPESVLEATFPASPTIVFELKNVDAEDFRVTEGGSYRSGRFARCNFMVLGPDDGTMPLREWTYIMGGGMSQGRRLAPGESIGGELPLGDFVELTWPCTYRVRLRYHDHEDIDSASDLAGRFVSSSEEFRVEMRPLRIELTQARLDEMRGWIRAIEAKKPVLLVRSHWDPDLKFDGLANDPEDKLFCAGWEAVPALFGALQDQTTEAERRAWVFGMLWNILGIENPGNQRSIQALGTMVWHPKWPTSTAKANAKFGLFGDWDPMPIDREAQDALAEAWMRWQSLIDVVIVP